MQRTQCAIVVVFTKQWEIYTIVYCEDEEAERQLADDDHSESDLRRLPRAIGLALVGYFRRAE